MEENIEKLKLKKIVILTGAGMSAESGISTFRDAGGLWEGHRVEDVASPEGWFKNQDLVLDFYNKRRSQLLEVDPNEGHKSLIRLEQTYQTVIITQNVDDLHERAGSHQVLHLHGELKKVRSTGPSQKVYDWEKDVYSGDLCENGYQLRPHIVWFGEEVPMIAMAARHVAEADVLLIIGTSLQVYPAAGLIQYAQRECPVYYIDPNPHTSYELQNHRQVMVIKETAVKGVPGLVDKLLSL